MKKVLFLLFSFFFIAGYSRSQILPKEGSRLNYRLIGFSFPGVKKNGGYTIEIASGNYNTEAAFKKNIIKSVSYDSSKVILEVPSFGQQYTWRYISASSEPGELHHFATGAIPNVDTGKMHLRILKEADICKDGYVFLDANMVLYNMKGEPVWYLPDISGQPAEHAEVRDLKCSPKGTITFLYSDMPFEIDYNGSVLWKGPNNGKVSGEREEYYHHEFTRLTNGHYMTLGNNFAAAKPNAEELKEMRRTGFNPVKMIQYGTIIEYDPQGNVVWSWKSSKFHKDLAIEYPIKPNGLQESETHQNAFYFNEKTKMVYMSFKNINQVVKVKYPEGTVLRSYGKMYKPGDRVNNLFCEQHSCKLTRKGYLLLFNNNVCNWPHKPSLVMFSEPVSGKDALKKVWEYVTDAAVTGFVVEEKQYNSSGGNVIELPDQSVFASMCTPYANIFIVGLDKKIRWNAVSEKWSEQAREWKPVAQYRASFVTRREMEQMVWGQ